MSTLYVYPKQAQPFSVVLDKDELVLGRAVDAEVRYSWLMLGREPRSTAELVMVYASILGHGTALSAAETARMIPQLSATAIRQAMRFAANVMRQTASRI